jgi:hypothetical protein
MIWNFQFCFDANNYIISLQKYVAFQYSRGRYPECRITMSMVSFVEYLEQGRGNKNLTH